MYFANSLFTVGISPNLLILLLILNFNPRVLFHVPYRDDLSNFYKISSIYIYISVKFSIPIVSHYANQGRHVLWSRITLNSLFLSFRLAIILASVILLVNDVHNNPGPVTNKNLNICYWNFGGLPTGNVLKKYLFEAFLTVNDFDIVALSETHITSRINDEDVAIDGYTLIRFDHPDDISRGGVAVYYKFHISLILKPELTNLSEILVFQVQVSIAYIINCYGFIQPTNFEPKKNPSCSDLIL